MSADLETAPMADAANINATIQAHYTERVSSMAFLEGGTLVGAIRVEGQMMPLYADSPVVRSDRQIVDEPEDKTFSPSAVYFGSLDGTYDVFDEPAVNSVALLAFFEEAVAPLTPPKNAPIETSNQYGLRQYRALDSDMTSRSGILTRFDSENDEQLLVTMYGDQPYLVEVKGCGMPRGGFKATRNRLFSQVIVGGLLPGEAQKEYANLSSAHREALSPIVPVAVGRLACSDTDMDPHVVLRLTPSTIRLSHVASLDLLPTKTSEQRGFILNKLADNFLDKFLEGDLRDIFVSPASHLENYLISDDIAITETDFEDWRVFGGDELPFVHTQTAQFVSTKDVIRHYFINFSRLNGYDEAQDIEAFKQHVVEHCASKDVIIDLNDAETMADVANRLWDQWLIIIDYKEQQRRCHAPHALTDFFEINFEGSLKIGREMSGKDMAYCQASNLRALLMDTCSDNPSVKEFLYLGDYLAVLSSLDVSLSERAIILNDLVNTYPALYSATKDSLSPFLDDDNLIHLINSYLDQFEKELELAMRMYIGLRCYEKFLNSEIERRQKLLKISGVLSDDDRPAYEETLQNFSREQRKLRAVAESPDPMALVEYFWSYFEESIYRVTLVS